MPFKFKWFVQLLETLDAAQKRDPHVRYAPIIQDWFGEHDDKIERTGPSAVAFLSCLFPERLPHRNYGVREATLINILSGICLFSSSRVLQFKAWKKGNLDFAECFEGLLAQAQMPTHPEDRQVTLEEIDAALFQLAANSRTATLHMRQFANDVAPIDLLRPIFMRLHSTEAKWLVRMILKNYRPVMIPEHTTFRCFHFLLPNLLRFQNSLQDAITVLGHPEVAAIPHNPASNLQSDYSEIRRKHLAPKLGVMVKRHEYEKARGIKNCLNLANHRLMSAERKYDGEYCQIHIDKAKGRDCIQIFSKSGKDSTEDRIRLHGALEYGLRLNQPDCGFTENCIVEGELIVWSHSKRAFQPFHVIRKHVMHGGKYRGIEADSPRRWDESVMIVFYDLLLLDNKNFTMEPHSERRKQLERIVQRREGLAQIGQSQTINFAAATAKEELLELFDYAINQKWEGLVLKGSRDTYFSWDKSSSVVKLKKDLMGLGDVADLCVVGGRREQIVVDELKIGTLEWTSFYVACLENKEEVRRFDVKPVFRVLSTVSHHSMSKETMLALNQKGRFLQMAPSDSTDLLEVQIDQPELRLKPPTALFREPFVVELSGGGFDKPQGTSYFALRFPRNVKLHEDRTIVDTHTFQELQDMAKESLTPCEEPEGLEWQSRLVAADGGSSLVDLHANGTPSRSSVTTRSPSSIMSTSVGVFARPGLPSPVINRTLEVGRILKRKIEGSSMSPGANKRVKPNHCGRRLLPLHSVSGNPTGSIHPYNPPAVFLSPTKAASKTAVKAPITNPRQPLSELKNVSPKRGLEQAAGGAKNHQDDNEAERARSKTTSDTREEDNASLLVKPANASTISESPITHLDKIIKSALGASALSNHHHSACDPVMTAGNEILITLVDKDLPNVVANTIRLTVRDVLKAWRCSGRPAEQDSRSRQRSRRKRMILFYDHALSTYLTARNQHTQNTHSAVDGDDDGHSGSSSGPRDARRGNRSGNGYNLLLGADTRLLFAGCLVFNHDFVSDGSEEQDEARERENENTNAQVTWQAIFKWETAMQVLRELHS